MVKIEGTHIRLFLWCEVPIEVVLSDMQEAAGRVVLFTAISMSSLGPRLQQRSLQTKTETFLSHLHVFSKLRHDFFT
jgi:hypothetical protein